MVIDPFRMETRGRGGATRVDEWKLLDPLMGDSMLELGNKRNGDVIYKAFFESLGFRHVSIDWNGLDGTLNRDLRLPLWDELGQFCMVTNIGTTEHVDGQAGVWENIHRMTKPGGVYCGLTPYPDGKSWWWHGSWYPTAAFFESFADLNGWVIEKIYKDRPDPFSNLYCRMQKLAHEVDFTMPDMALIKHNKIRPR
jgi:SAM-dependent methyltransferase